MSGSEIVPAAKAVGKAAKSVVGEDASVKQQLADMARDHPAMKSAADKYAQRIEIKQAFLLKLYGPLARLAGTSREYFDGEFAADMQEKLSEIPEDDLSCPKPSVAVPAMQALGYSLDEPELKEMYLELLATATDRRTESKAHPSFAEIIRQLTAAEAKGLRILLTAGQVPIVEVRRNREAANSFSVVIRHLINWRTSENVMVEEPSTSIWLENWTRLGLIAVDFTVSYTDKTTYAWVQQRPEYLKHAEAAAAEQGTVSLDHGVLRVTDFGKRFAAAVGMGNK